ncbi:lipopolysaccharide biosynthesis protein [Hungatella effluvii]|uniref:lipopolysaccharide biosynthesis protein n=1 Tax=Hungatella effluvii TaxID=1096246 RepID=UPI0022E7CEC1|nr:polysaccharide biosynthesis C-terminal domain-containing protein [Hungatella effluvii]
MKINVAHNAKINLAFGLINKVLILILPFVERTVMRYVLGSEYLGLNSLFSSILSVLSLAELGFGSAIVYNMYKPIADNDIKEINSLLNLYRQVYFTIGLIVLVIGLLLIPFLPNLISGTYPQDANLTMVYLLYLLNSVISYFLYSYLSSLLVVYQREDVHSIITMVTTVGMYVSKIVIIYFLKNYYIATMTLPAFTILQNLSMAVVIKRMYPQFKCEGKIEHERLQPIKKLIAGTFISRACAVTRNSLDSICISAFLGLALTAIYNNYYIILHSVTVALSIVSTSLIGGIGNHVVTKSANENYHELEIIDFAYMIISGWCTVCLLCLYQPFMRLWMGNEMLLPLDTVMLFCLYFYVLKIGDMRAMYSTTNGLWWHHRYRAMIETVCNLILNIMLGKLFGINGIIIATVISLIFCNTIWATHITFKLYFKEKRYIKGYYLYQAKYGAVTLIACGLSFIVCSILMPTTAIMQFIINGIICIIVPGIVFFFILKNNLLLKELIRIVRKR